VPEQNVHQRRLAGAVLAHQRQDLASSELEVDRVIGDQRAEAPGDAAQRQDDGGIGGVIHGSVRASM
jgi:hypothetical protein